MTPRHMLIGILLALVAPTGLCAADAPAVPDGFRQCAGTYSGAPRLPDGHVDIPLLLKQLGELHADTYNWLIWTSPHDWHDLQTFLPAARERGIRVWVSLVPPSESPPHAKNYAEPFRLDYDRWAEEIARLSVAHPNLVAWSIDDFTHNLKVFTPEKTKQIQDKAKAISPKLAFIPCCYFKAVTPNFAKGYAPLLDGLLFPYRNESRGANLKDADAVTAEVARLRELLGEKVAVIVDVYSTAHSRLGPSTPQYVRQVMTDGLKCADGVIVYCHPIAKADLQKYEVVRDVYAARPNNRPTDK